MTENIPSSNNRVQIELLIAKYDELSYPDQHLSRQLLKLLGIYDIVELEKTLNSKNHQERLAAVKMITRHLEALLSENPELWMEAKDTLSQFYYRVNEIDEEGFL